VVVDEHQPRIGGDVVDELGHPHAVLALHAQRAAAVQPVGGVEAALGHGLPRRQLAGGDREVEVREPHVEDRDALAGARDPPAPERVGPDPEGALAHERGAYGRGAVEERRQSDGERDRRPQPKARTSRRSGPRRAPSWRVR
jgi:hypothetical protein